MLMFYIRILVPHNFTLIKEDVTRLSNLNENGYTVEKNCTVHIVFGLCKNEGEAKL